MMSTIGIDFGGSALRVAVDRDGTLTVPEMDPGAVRLPRILRLVDGPSAGQKIPVILSLKRILDFDEVVVSDAGEVETLEYAAQLFKRIRDNISIFPEGQVPHAVVSTSPCSSQRQRSSLRTAMNNAGFARVKLVDDTLAAVLGSQDLLCGRQSILVYSWGASAFCAALYQRAGESFGVVTHEGSQEWGGDDIDSKLLNRAMNGVPLQQLLSWGTAQRLFDDIRRAKLVLAGGKRSIISLKAFGFKTGDGRAADVEIPSKLFDGILAPMIADTMKLVEKVFAESKCAQPDAVLLNGGTTLLPAVGRVIEAHFPGRVVRVNEMAVALGAAMYGRMLPETDWEQTEKRRKDPLHRQARVEPRNQGESSLSAAHPSQKSPDMALGSWATTYVPLLNQTERFEKEDQLDHAVEVLDRLHENLGKRSAWIYFKAATPYLARGEADKALTLLRKANHVDPLHAQSATALADLCAGLSLRYVENRQADKAHRLMQEGLLALEKLPATSWPPPKRQAEYFHIEALACSAMGRLAEARDWWERCIKLDPGEAQYAKCLSHVKAALLKTTAIAQTFSPVRAGKTGRNEDCPCGSGKKFKRCCGQ